MTDREEWSEWVDGSYEPPKGAYIQVVITDYDEIKPDLIHKGVYIGLSPEGGLIMLPPFTEPGEWTLDRWRQRKPRGLTILQELIDNLPVPERVMEYEGA